MSNHSAQDELKFVTQWFSSWSEFQKEDFLLILAEKLCPKAQEAQVVPNGLSNGLGLRHESGRPPSLFSCQVKLFKEWWDNHWNEEDRGKLTTAFKETDSKFWHELEAEISGTRKKVEEEFYAMLDRDALESAELITGTGGEGNPNQPSSTPGTGTEDPIKGLPTPDPKEKDETITITGPESTEVEESMSVSAGLSEGITTIHITGEDSTRVVEPASSPQPQQEELDQEK